MADPITQVVQSLGLVTAYGYAKSKGYTGTEEEFAEAAAAIGQGAATASAAAEAASEDAETATTAAGTATTKATAAATSASEAYGYMQGAEAASGDATTAKNAAEGYASTASAKATAAAYSEYNAGLAAGASSDYALVSQDHSEDSEAWAVGTKNGTDVPATAEQYNNNAKYYADQAETQVGDASASATAAASSATAAAASAVSAEAWATGGSGGTASATNNAKYYSEQAAASAATLTLDATLTSATQAAQAKATGDKIAETQGILTGIFVESGIELEWAQGSIGSSGSISTSDTRVRTSRYYTGDAKVRLVIPAGLKIFPHYYAAETGTDGHVGAGWITEAGDHILTPSADYFRLVCAYAGDTAILPEAASGVEIYTMGFTDKTLTQDDKAADAKTVGERLGAADSAIQQNAAETQETMDCILTLTSGGTYNGFTSDKLQWEKGSISASGANTAGNNRIRTVGWFKFPNYASHGAEVQISADNGFKFRFLWGTYDADSDTYTKVSETGSAIDQTIYTVPASVIVAGYYFRLLMANANNDNIIVPADSSNLSFAIRDENGEATEAFPSYFSEQLDEAVSSVRDNMQSVGINGETFIFMSDLHWAYNEKHSPALTGNIVSRTGIRKIICGGDIMSDEKPYTKRVDNAIGCVQGFQKHADFHVAIGNHDALSATPKAAQYAIYHKHLDYGIVYGEPCYFYFDNPTTKTRFIFLDTGNYVSSLDANQETWLTNTLDDTPVGWHILVFEHIIYNSNNWDVGLKPENLYRTTFAESVCTILDDFNAEDNGTKVEAFFGGHVHIDADFSTPGGIPIILIDCDCSQTKTTKADGTTKNYDKGTVTEQCFDIVTISYTESVIDCVRVGRGQNRTFQYGEP